MSYGAGRFRKPDDTPFVSRSNSNSAQLTSFFHPNELVLHILNEDQSQIKIDIRKLLHDTGTLHMVTQYKMYDEQQRQQVMIPLQVRKGRFLGFASEFFWGKKDQRVEGKHGQSGVVDAALEAAIQKKYGKRKAEERPNVVLPSEQAARPDEFSASQDDASSEEEVHIVGTRTVQERNDQGFANAIRIE